MLSRNHNTVLRLDNHTFGPTQHTIPAYHVLPYDREPRYMNPPAPTQHTKTQPHHGIKRGAPDDEIEASSNISTEFKKLRLNNVRPALAKHHGTDVPVNHSHHRSQHFTTSVLDNSKEHSRNHRNESVDSMTVDETPDRVYISDLDREIAEIEAAESRQNLANGSFFLPDIDKNISKIPLNVLRQEFDAACASPSPDRAANQQALILYRDPSSITVPEEEDVVRKAIIASRRQARERMKQEHERQLLADRTHASTENSPDVPMDEDIDAMDIE